MNLLVIVDDRRFLRLSSTDVPRLSSLIVARTLRQPLALAIDAFHFHIRKERKILSRRPAFPPSIFYGRTSFVVLDRCSNFASASRFGHRRIPLPHSERTEDIESTTGVSSVYLLRTYLVCRP
ncbi:uncharacterized protein [Temnothorax longispinosus]|uniref:uncharacterized protein n=1 Tax=Temnothorax longispinosus TaxID=300112 RepID=UPI003A99A494